MPVEVRAGHPTFWQRLGSGSRPALAVHCSLAHSGEWTEIAKTLGDRLTITAFDLPGHGKSADLPVGGDFPALSIAVAERFLGDAPVDLVGHSFGGLVALRLALLHPGKVRSLTLIEPVLFASAIGTNEYYRHLADMADYDSAARSGDRERAARCFSALWGTEADWKALSDRARQALVARIDLIAAGVPLTEDVDALLLYPGGLEGLALPVLLIHGTASPAVVAPICNNLATRLPDARVRVIESAGHMMPVTHAEEVATLIGDFLSR